MSDPKEGCHEESDTSGRRREMGHSSGTARSAMDAVIKRPLASLSAIVNEGNLNVRFLRSEYEHWPEDFDEQEARRVCGAAGRTSGYEIDEDCEV